MLVISDMQIPYNHKRATLGLYDYIKTHIASIDEIVSVGDDVDFPQVSRWSRGMEGEYAQNLQSHVDAGVTHFSTLRELAGNKPISVMRSNHMDRPLTYVRKYAPGLMGLRALTVPGLLQFDELDITFHTQPVEIAPGWLLAHGDEGSLVKSAGGTALGLAKKWGRSVVCGHTHRLGLQHEHHGYNLATNKHVYGFEVGNLMDMKKATYLSDGYANWQMGIGLLLVSNKRVVPVPVPVFEDGTVGVSRGILG